MPSRRRARVFAKLLVVPAALSAVATVGGQVEGNATTTATDVTTMEVATTATTAATAGTTMATTVTTTAATSIVYQYLPYPNATSNATSAVDAAQAFANAGGAALGAAAAGLGGSAFMRLRKGAAEAKKAKENLAKQLPKRRAAFEKAQKKWQAKLADVVKKRKALLAAKVRVIAAVARQTAKLAHFAPMLDATSL